MDWFDYSNTLQEKQPRDETNRAHENMTYGDNPPKDARNTYTSPLDDTSRTHPQIEQCVVWGGVCSELGLEWSCEV